MPSVTISDGKPSIVTSAPFSAPPTSPVSKCGEDGERDRGPCLDDDAEHDAAQRQHAGDRQVDFARNDQQHHRQDNQRPFRHAGNRLRNIESGREIRNRDRRVGQRRGGQHGEKDVPVRKAFDQASVSWAPPSPPAPASDRGVDRDRRKDHHAVDALQPERIDPHQRQAVLDDEQCQRSEHDAGTVPAPPRIATPPTTTDAMTVSSKPMATRASIVA